MKQGDRVNVVSPLWVKEILETMGRESSGGMPAVQEARAYVTSMEGSMSGSVLDVRKIT